MLCHNHLFIIYVITYTFLDRLTHFRDRDHPGHLVQGSSTIKYTVNHGTEKKVDPQPHVSGIVGASSRIVIGIHQTSAIGPYFLHAYKPLFFHYASLFSLTLGTLSSALPLYYYPNSPVYTPRTGLSESATRAVDHPRASSQLQIN